MSDQTQMHSHEVSKKRSFDLSQSYPGHQIADLGHPHEVKCTVRFSNFKPVDEDNDDQKLPARQEVPKMTMTPTRKMTTRRPNNYSNDRERSPSLLDLVMGLYLPPSLKSSSCLKTQMI
jgi:hypothetical protein